MESILPESAIVEELAIIICKSLFHDVMPDWDLFKFSMNTARNIWIEQEGQIEDFNLIGGGFECLKP